MKCFMFIVEYDKEKIIATIIYISKSGLSSLDRPNREIQDQRNSQEKQVKKKTYILEIFWCTNEK